MYIVFVYFQFRIQDYFAGVDPTPRNVVMSPEILAEELEHQKMTHAAQNGQNMGITPAQFSRIG
jgi:hypothetical protein